MFGGSWRLVETKSGKWFIVNFITNSVYNIFGQHKNRYKYVSEPYSLEKAREILEEKLNNY